MISIIIPVLNEAEMIGGLLEHLSKNSTKGTISDIIVVDGGSRDGTQDIVSGFVNSSDFKHCNKSHIDNPQQNYHEVGNSALSYKALDKNSPYTSRLLMSNTMVDPETYFDHLSALPSRQAGVQDFGSTPTEALAKVWRDAQHRRSGLANQAKLVLLNSPKGRARQMNLGAKYAQGRILYFLHADAFPPKNFDRLIINEVKKGNNAGCFRMQFNSNHWWLRLASWLTQFSWRACRGGDQSQFITKALFDKIGGYDEDYIIYEDNILINELYKRKEFVVINKKIRTSARLYKKVGIWKLQYHFWAIYVKRWLGATAEEMLAYYKKNIG